MKTLKFYRMSDAENTADPGKVGVKNGESIPAQESHSALSVKIPAEQISTNLAAFNGNSQQQNLLYLQSMQMAQPCGNAPQAVLTNGEARTQFSNPTHQFTPSIMGIPGMQMPYFVQPQQQFSQPAAVPLQQFEYSPAPIATMPQLPVAYLDRYHPIQPLPDYQFRANQQNNCE